MTLSNGFHMINLMIGDNMTKITPETYEKMNEEFIESDEAFRIVVPTQESIDKWQERSGVYHNYDYPKPDLVAEHWKRYNEAKGQEDSEIDLLKRQITELQAEISTLKASQRNTHG